MASMQSRELRRFRSSADEQTGLNERDLALNLSFVLHEHSSSHAVRSAIHAIDSHAGTLRRVRGSAATPVTRTGDVPGDVSRWITAAVGLPHLLAGALGVASEQVFQIDIAVDDTQPYEFFRAPARLALPDDRVSKVGVAALVLRPDRRTSHLIVAGTFRWPDERHAALRAIERIVQAHAGQWMPGRTLWSAAAEHLMPDEVYLGTDDASRMS